MTKPWTARSAMSFRADPTEAVLECLADIQSESQQPLRGLLIYFSQNHETAELFRAIGDHLGTSFPSVGVSVQGASVQNEIQEDGYLCALCAFYGDIDIRVSCIEDLAVDTLAKGKALAKNVSLVEQAQVSLLFYDPLTGANTRTLLQGIEEAAPGHAVIGAAASGPWGPMIETFQVHNGRILQGAAMLMTLGGNFDVVTAASTGTEQTTHTMTVTRVDNNRILEIDHQPALDVWRDAFGKGDITIEESSNWAFGIERGGPGCEQSAVVQAFAWDENERSIQLQTDIGQGTKITLHQRSPEVIFERIASMGEEITEKVGDRDIGAVLGFECGARTSPFLGTEATERENALLQSLVSKSAAWLGLLAWGEIVPMNKGSEYFNYTYPILVMCHRQTEK